MEREAGGGGGREVVEGMRCEKEYKCIGRVKSLKKHSHIDGMKKSGFVFRKGEREEATLIAPPSPV
jgi:hypothetical protein